MAEKSWPMSVQKRAGSLAALSAMREKSGSLADRQEKEQTARGGGRRRSRGDGQGA